MTRRSLAMRLLLTPLLAGMVVASGLVATWVAVKPASGAVWMQVVKTGEAHATSGAPDQPFFFLLVGNDSSADRGNGNGLGDALHLVGVNPAAGAATIINIPRDTEGPNGGKINAYHSLGGLRAQANAVGQVVGVNVPYAVTVNFDHFTAMVDAMGGISINVPTDMNDPDSGSNFRAGPQVFNGDKALAFSRDRKSFATGDIQRTTNQATLIIAALATLRGKDPNAINAVKWTALAARHVQLDGLGVGELYRFGRLALSLDPARIRNATIPVANSGGTNLAPTAEARGLFADFADDGVLQTH